MGATICINCKHYVHIVRNTQAPTVWYNHFCKAHPNKKQLNVVTGEVEFPDQPYAYCRNINNGHCITYERK